MESGGPQQTSMKIMRSWTLIGIRRRVPRIFMTLE